MLKKKRRRFEESIQILNAFFKMFSASVYRRETCTNRTVFHSISYELFITGRHWAYVWIVFTKKKKKAVHSTKRIVFDIWSASFHFKSLIESCFAFDKPTTKLIPFTLKYHRYIFKMKAHLFALSSAIALETVLWKKCAVFSPVINIHLCVFAFVNAARHIHSAHTIYIISFYLLHFFLFISFFYFILL